MAFSMGFSDVAAVEDESFDAASSGGVSLVASAELPSEYGDFRIFGFLEHETGKEHTAIVRGDVRGKRDVVCRIHSECHTGDVLGSLRCDCRDQLLYALEHIGKLDYGAVIYMKQEGRGIGLINKIKAYHLQDLGLDTVEANEALGFPAEGRSYETAAEIISLLEIQSVRLMSNNPLKFDGLRKGGVKITGRVPVVIQANKHNVHYLSTKAEKMGHVFDKSKITE
jgi:GTP cyclohydrolase II